MYTIKRKDDKYVRNEGSIMKQYLYIYNYASHEQALCEMEFHQIFHEPMTTKYYITHQDFNYQRSSYIRGKLDILVRSSHFEDILTYINQKQLCFYEFKVIYLKNEITHVHYQETIQKCKNIAFPINGSVNMQKPKVILAFTKLHEEWIFGIYHDDMVWNDRFHKPHSYSHSLPSKDARAFVNIAIGNQEDLTLVDPCCGIGTVVLEALSMDLNIHGYDINRYVAYQARLNLEHFGYDPLLIHRIDIHELNQSYDVMIMDIPYGIYSPFTYSEQCSLLKEAYRIASRFLLISHIPMDKELQDIGFEIIESCRIQKGNFQRIITLCQKEDPCK